VTTAVFILAAGAQTRLVGVLDHPKGLLHLGSTALPSGETIVERTARLAKTWFTEDVSLVIPPDVISWQILCTRHNLHRVIAPGDHALPLLDRVRGLLDGWRSSTPDCFIFLLGDVVYSEATLGGPVFDAAHNHRLALIGRRGPNFVTGKTWGEVYALVVPVLTGPFVVSVIDYLKEQGNNLKLWDLTEALGTAHFVEVDPSDFTDDIDTPEDLEHVLPKLRAAVAAEVL
jgi:CTP:molybdopterin cytidylyltransferase MocA